MKPELTRNPNLALRSKCEGTGAIASKTAGDASDDDWRKNLRGDDAWVGPRPDNYWTAGIRPADAPGMDKNGHLHALPLVDLSQPKREDVLAHFNNVWVSTEMLFSALQGEEAFFRPPYHHLRHPLVFYFCHVAVVYVNKMRIAGLLESIDEYNEEIFETGVDEMSWDDLSKNTMLWPSLQDVLKYRREAYLAIREVIESHPALDGKTKIGMDHPLWALFMGFEHERIHLETSSVLIRELPVNLLVKPEHWPAYHPSAGAKSSFPPVAGTDYPSTKMIAVAEGTVRLGKPNDFPSFGWDNEYGTRTVNVPAFEAAASLTSNGEFWEFVKDGGYREEKYWTTDGWGWKTFRNAKWPTFWVPTGPAGLHQYNLRTIFEIIEMPWSWPADVNCHEATAFCNWKRERTGSKVPLRLLSEAEHHMIREAANSGRGDKAIEVDPAMQASGETIAKTLGLNINMAFGSQHPVDALLSNSQGFHDVFGNVWHWLMDHFNPLPHSKPHPFYDDFSTPCYDGKHNMIIGGSFMSCGDEASAFSRFHFRPHFFQHAGFRVAAADGDGGAVFLGGSESNPYESEVALNQYLGLHYATPEESLPFGGPTDALDFPARCARLVTDAVAKYGIPTGRALDLGCAVGRSSFELARVFDEIMAVDLSRGFINAANRLKEAGELKYVMQEQGDILRECVARVPEDLNRKQVNFRVGDACQVPEMGGAFDAILMANLLCRVPNPRKLLAQFAGPDALVKPGGLVVMTTPFTWMEDYTAKDQWIGAAPSTGSSFDVLKSVMADLGYTLLESKDFPLLIREHSRKYQYIVSYASIWQRRQD